MKGWEGNNKSGVFNLYNIGGNGEKIKIMKTIAVTGGAGFIGSHLCEALLKQGNKVIIIDNFNNFYPKEIKESNILEIQKFCEDNQIHQSNLLLYREDILRIDTVEKIFEENDVNVVVHLAAYAGVRPSIDQPRLYYDVNIGGTLNILECMKKYNVDKMIFASSSSVYGNNKKIPFSEEDSVDNPISPYAATKKSGELLCHTYHELYGISIACLRFFTVFGPRQRPDLAIHKFTKLIMEGKQVPFFGDGSTRRDYTYITDIINGINKAIIWVCSQERRFDIFNLGESNTISLEYMVNTIERALNKKAMLNKLPRQPGDVEITNADITKSVKTLGYSPQTNFEEGIKNFIEWYKFFNQVN